MRAVLKEVFGEAWTDAKRKEAKKMDKQAVVRLFHFETRTVLTDRVTSRSLEPFVAHFAKCIHSLETRDPAVPNLDKDFKNYSWAKLGAFSP
eukprot:13371787-Alexandrium_andersonii.AAC.1